HPVAAAATAKLFELKPIRRVLFVLGRHVITLFALSALQYNVISWHILIPYSRFQIPDSIWNPECGIWNSFLFNNFRNRSCSDCSAAFADGEAEAFFHGDRGDEGDLHLDVVTRHDHLDTGGQVCDSRHVRCSEVEL